MKALNEALLGGSHAQAGDTYSDSSRDSEVDFHPRHTSQASIDFEDEDEIDMAQERRLQLLESAVIGMSDKFDAVLSSLGSRIDDTEGLAGAGGDAPGHDTQGQGRRPVLGTRFPPHRAACSQVDDYIALQL